MVTRSPIINVMVRAADRAARGLKRDFGEVENLQVSRKGPADFVTTADLKAEQTLRQELGKARPDYGFLMEESGSRPAKNDCQRRWIVDPLDGTTNFMHGLPHFAISIALEEAGDILAGIVYDPIKEDLYIAEKGIGAYHNGRRMRVSARRHIREAVVTTGIPHLGSRDPDSFTGELQEVMRQTAGVRCSGAAALDLAYVASGRYDAYWDRDLNIWDIAAGVLLVRESGGNVTDIDNEPLDLMGKSILASNTALHSPIGKLLSKSLAYQTID